MKKVETKNIMKGLFGLFATLALSIGVGVSLAPKEAARTQAADTLVNSFNFNDGGSSNVNNYATTNTTTNVSYASDNPGGASGTTAWEADWANLSGSSWTRLGGKAASSVQTDDTTAWANIRTKFAFAPTINKVEILAAATFGTAGNVGNSYLQYSTNGTAWTTEKTITTALTSTAVTQSFDNLSIPENSYLRYGIALTASDTNSGVAFTGIKVYTGEEGPEPIAVSGVALNKPSTTIKTDESETLIATVSPTDASNKSVEWTSDKPQFATVSNSGLVTGIAPGNATITVRTVDGNYTADCLVTVLQNPHIIDKFSVKGFAGSTTSSYASAVGDYIDSVGTEETKLALRVFLGNDGAIRGNQTTGIADNFSMRNIDMYPGYIRKIVINGTGGTFNETSSATRNLVNVGNVAYDLNNATEGEKIEAVYTVNGSVHTLTWTIPEEVNARYFIMHNLHAGGTMLAAAADAVQIFYEPVSSVVSALSADKSSKSYFTTDVLEESDFIVSVTMDGAPGTSGAYSAKIGTGKGAAFEGTDIVWGTTKPTVEDETIQFKAKFPQTPDGSDYLFFDVDLIITEPEVEIIVISGDLIKKAYFTTDSWNPNGLTVTAIYENDAEVDVTNDSGLSWSFAPVKPNSVSITSVEVTATFSGETDTKEITGISVSEKPTIVISEVYGAGGNGGAVLKQDYIELYNNGESEVDLAGWTIWYASNAGSFSKSNNMYKTLTGKISAKSYYLIQLAGGANGADLPYYDELGTINMGATNFKVALTNDFEIPSGSDGSNVIDFVGGGTANDYEGEGSAKGASATKSISRTLDDGLMVDTGDNDADFTSGDPSPITGHHGAAQKFAAFVMSYDGGNLATEECAAKFAAALIEWNKLSGSAKTIFKTDDDYKGSEGAFSRFTHWALINGYSSLDSIDALPDGVKFDNAKDSPITATIIIGVIGLTTLSGYYFLKKKKEA